MKIFRVIFSVSLLAMSFVVSAASNATTPRHIFVLAYECRSEDAAAILQFSVTRTIQASGSYSHKVDRNVVFTDLQRNLTIDLAKVSLGNQLDIKEEYDFRSIDSNKSQYLFDSLYEQQSFLDYDHYVNYNVWTMNGTFHYPLNGSVVSVFLYCNLMSTTLIK